MTSINSLKIGVIGATGLVGKTLLTILCDHGYAQNIKTCASDSSIGTVLNINKNNTYNFVLEQLTTNFFSDIDVVFFCADTDTSLVWVPYAQKKGIFVIDNSSAFRMNSDIPLIVPEINRHLIETSKGIIANPNCCTALLCMVLYPLTKLSTILRVDVCTYQAVSGAGIAGITELETQSKEYINGEPLTKKTFGSQIYGNCFSHNTPIDVETGFCEEELKISHETTKIIPTIKEVSATCIRIGVYTSHSESIKLVFENPVEELDVIESLKNFAGVTVIDDRINNTFPEPVLASGNTNVFVGRIRKDLYDKSGKIYKLFLCGDQLLKGASWNAFQIFKEYEKKNI
jgi:aspartate-semialdehyde dehydrogenase